MAFHLTPDVLEKMYECLRAQLPFRRWRLPPAEEVEFRANGRKDVMGEHRGGDPHVITVSVHNNTTFVTAMMTLAHEMAHQAEDIAGKPIGHGAGFKRRVKAVAKALGVNEKDV